MTTMTSSLPSYSPLAERLVDAREAAYTMNLPQYYLTNAAQRDRLRVPYYRVGKLVRYKLSELAAWQRQQSRVDVTPEPREGADAGLQ